MSDDTEPVGTWKVVDQSTYKKTGHYPFKLGKYKMTFGQVDGYYTPEDVTLQLNDAGVLVVNYLRIPIYTLTVETYKKYINNVENFSGYWRFVGEEDWRSAGTNLEVHEGSYKIEFQEIDGFITPSYIVVKVDNNISVDGVYKLDVSLLHVNLAVDELVYPFIGQWCISGYSDWLNSGDVIDLQKDQTYTIAFQSLNDYYSPPASQNIILNDNENLTYYFTTNYHILTVNLNVGYWKIYGEESWRNSGTSTILQKNSTYTIVFSDVTNYKTPSNYTVTMNSSKEINIQYLAYVTLTINLNIEKDINIRGV